MINHNTYRLKTYEFRHICLKHGKQRDKVNKNIDPKHRIISNMKEYVGIKIQGRLQKSMDDTWADSSIPLLPNSTF